MQLNPNVGLRTRRQRLLGVFVIVTLLGVVSAQAARSHDVPLTKQIGEVTGENGGCNPCVLPVLHQPAPGPSLPSLRPLWIFRQPGLDLLPAIARAPHLGRAPPLAL